MSGGTILILDCSWIRQEGRRIAISRSKIRNRIITKKNLVENEDLFLEISLNPHSNWVFFSIKKIWLCDNISIPIIRKIVKVNLIIVNEGIFISFISF